jgi:PQQ-like domain
MMRSLEDRTSLEGAAMPRSIPRSVGVVILTCLSLSLISLPPVAQARGSQPLRRGMLWLSRYHGAANGYDDARALALTPDGATVFVTGLSEDAPCPDCWDYGTVAYDAATGAQRWASTYNGPAAGEDDATAIVVSPNGTSVFVTGQSWSGASDYDDYATVAYDAATGAQRWVARYTGLRADQAADLAVSPDGSTLFVTGQSEGLRTRFDYATVAYDAATGTQRWVARYTGPGAKDDFATAVRVGPDGSVVYVTGQSDSLLSSDDYATVAYDAATGTQRWVARYDDPDHGSDDGIALGMSPDGASVFVTGQSGGANGYDYATIAYDAMTGVQKWVARYDGPAHEEDDATALGLSPDGSTVYVTGQSEGSDSGFDDATVAYDAGTGSQEWVARFDGPLGGIDESNALAVGPAGRTVYIAGSSDYPLRRFTTIAYDAATGEIRTTVVGPDGSGQALALNPSGGVLFVTGFDQFQVNAGYETTAYSLVP